MRSVIVRSVIGRDMVITRGMGLIALSSRRLFNLNWRGRYLGMLVHVFMILAYHLRMPDDSVYHRQTTTGLEADCTGNPAGQSASAYSTASGHQ